MRLLRGDVFQYQTVLAEVQFQLSGELAAAEAATITTALHAFALWDDSDIEWVSDLDPDAVLELHGEELLAAGRKLSRELLGKSPQRLGIDRNILIGNVMPRVLWGLPPEGNDEPLPTQN